jgi:hypothetical protein
MKKLKLCLEHNDQGVVKMTLGGMVRHFIITRDTFWEWFRYIREHEPKAMSYSLLLMGNPQICGTPFVDDPEVNKLTNIAFMWERTNTPPTWLYPDCDRGYAAAISNIVWNASQEWQDMKAEEARKKAESAR